MENSIACKNVPVKIVSIGVYDPPHVLTAEQARQNSSRELGKELSMDHFTVAERRIRDGDAISDHAAVALKNALAEAKLDARDLDLIIFGSSMPEQPIPATSVLLHRKMGLDGSGVACFDVNSTCTSFLTGFEIASSLLASGFYKRIAVVTSEIGSKGINWAELESANLFGDGAAAVILEKDPHSGSKVLNMLSRTFSNGVELCEIRAGGSKWNIRTPPPSEKDYLFTMDGRGVYKLASKQLPLFLDDLLSPVGLKPSDIDWIVPHQASPLAMQHIVKKLGFSEERVINIIQQYGNQVSTSIPMALYHCVSVKKAKRGQKILLIGTGAGLIISGALIVY